jgi:hypothetical protein
MLYGHLADPSHEYFIQSKDSHSTSSSLPSSMMTIMTSSSSPSFSTSPFDWYHSYHINYSLLPESLLSPSLAVQILFSGKVVQLLKKLKQKNPNTMTKKYEAREGESRVSHTTIISASSMRDERRDSEEGIYRYFTSSQYRGRESTSHNEKEDMKEKEEEDSLLDEPLPLNSFHSPPPSVFPSPDPPLQSSHDHIRRSIIEQYTSTDLNPLPPFQDLFHVPEYLERIWNESLPFPSLQVTSSSSPLDFLQRIHQSYQRSLLSWDVNLIRDDIETLIQDLSQQSSNELWNEMTLSERKRESGDTGIDIFQQLEFMRNTFLCGKGEFYQVRSLLSCHFFSLLIIDKAFFDNLHWLITSPHSNSSSSSLSHTNVTTNHLLHTHVFLPTCKSLHIDEDETTSLMSFSLATSSVHLATFQPSNGSQHHSASHSLQTLTPPIYSLTGATEVIPLSSLPLGHLEGTYTGKLNASMRSFCRMGCYSPSHVSENSLREEYWHHLMLLTNSDPVTTPLAPSAGAVSLQDTISYIPASLWLNSSFFIQKGFTSTLSFTVKHLEKTIDYLNRYPVIMEALSDSPPPASSTTAEDSSLANFFLGRELFLSHSPSSSQPRELFLGAISCCVFSGNLSARHKLKKNSIGRSLPSISIFDAMGVTLPGSIHLGVSYHGLPLLTDQLTP